MELSEDGAARAAWQEVAEHFEDLMKTLDALGPYQPDSSSKTHLKRALAAAARGAQVARSHVDEGS